MSVGRVLLVTPDLALLDAAVDDVPGDEVGKAWRFRLDRPAA